LQYAIIASKVWIFGSEEIDAPPHLIILTYFFYQYTGCQASKQASITPVFLPKRVIFWRFSIQNFKNTLVITHKSGGDRKLCSGVVN